MTATLPPADRTGSHASPIHSRITAHSHEPTGSGIAYFCWNDETRLYDIGKPCKIPHFPGAIEVWHFQEGGKRWKARRM